MRREVVHTQMHLDIDDEKVRVKVERAHIHIEGDPLRIILKLEQLAERHGTSLEYEIHRYIQALKETH